MRAFHAVLASTLVAAAAMFGCLGAPTDESGDATEITGEADSQLSALGKRLVGSYDLKSGSSHLQSFTLKSDGTYAGDTGIRCFRAPCPSSESGRFTSSSTSDKYTAKLVLRPSNSNKQFKFTVHFPPDRGVTLITGVTEPTAYFYYRTPVDICATVRCAAGTHCDSTATNGPCVPDVVRDPCANFPCPSGQHCTAPADAPYCVADIISRDPCSSFTCPAGQHCTAPADAPFCTAN